MVETKILDLLGRKCMDILKILGLRKKRIDSSKSAIKLLTGQSCINCAHEQINLFIKFPPMYYEKNEIKEVTEKVLSILDHSTSGDRSRCTLEKDDSMGVCEWWREA